MSTGFRIYDSRALLIGAVSLLGLSVSPPLVRPGLADSHKPRRYHVVLENLTDFQGFSFPVAATHSPAVHMFQHGAFASMQAAAVAQNGNPVPMFQLFSGAAGVTDVYASPFPVASLGNPKAFWHKGLPYFNGTGLVPTTADNNLSDIIEFDISAGRHDVFSILGMMMCTNDGLTGLDGVALPRGEGHPQVYDLFAYDAGVEVNDYFTPDIVDPCGLMAPYTLGGSNGVPQVSVTDGNVNSPPSGTVAALATHDPIGPLSGVIPDHSALPNAASYVPAGWGWSGAVGRVTIRRIEDEDDRN